VIHAGPSAATGGTASGALASPTGSPVAVAADLGSLAFRRSRARINAIRDAARIALGTTVPGPAGAGTVLSALTRGVCGRAAADVMALAIASPQASYCDSPSYAAAASLKGNIMRKTIVNPLAASLAVAPSVARADSRERGPVLVRQRILQPGVHARRNRGRGRRPISAMAVAERRRHPRGLRASCRRSAAPISSRPT
jgi:hypothetical protein